MGHPAPLSIILDHCTLFMAKQCWPDGFNVGPDAPSSYKALVREHDKYGFITVFDGGSDHTIFGSPETNIAFRAWHDWCHLHLGADFSSEGEAAAAALQIKHLRQYGREHFIPPAAIDHAALLIDAEVNGQNRYYQKHKKYVKDQRSFAMLYLTNPEHALSIIWHED
ncbi:hypothetical protein HW532_20990 [Kaustia mangrovi]|uniref:Uncharacterized protein n=1 Tax=Kaustia mangrovi TaxID=2593653 RepID=A0A7S8C7S4_9HYPH|nr:hypothetical protein [Kaustia mangrovi]QPC44957.1 hypothetical protein HW532_20990 [Kaustia mangrovi]